MRSLATRYRLRCDVTKNVEHSIWWLVGLQFCEVNAHTLNNYNLVKINKSLYEHYTHTGFGNSH